MVLESTDQATKRWRWRPRKTPLPESKPLSKNHSTEIKASVVEKKAKHATMKQGLTREEELEAFETRSNKSGFLTLLILVLGIALIGYGMYQKIHQDELPLQNDTPIINETVIDQTTNKQTVLTDQKEITNGEKETIATPKNQLPANDTSNLIWKYFDLVNKSDTTAFIKLQDNSFNTLAPLRNYFGSTRLATFIKNTVDGIHIADLKQVTNDPVLQRNATAKVYDFNIKYVLKWDGKEYSDAWRWYTVVKWTWDTATTVINGFVYEWNSSSTSPFFQFAKYNIK